MVKELLNDLHIQAVESVTSSDIRMLLTLTGNSNGRLKHGCPFCNVSTPYTTDGELLERHTKDSWSS